MQPDLPENRAIGFTSARNLLANSDQTASELGQRTDSPGIDASRRDASPIGPNPPNAQLIFSETAEFEYDPFDDDFSHLQHDDEVSDEESNRTPGNSHPLSISMLFLEYWYVVGTGDGQTPLRGAGDQYLIFVGGDEGS